MPRVAIAGKRGDALAPRMRRAAAREDRHVVAARKRRVDEMPAEKARAAEDEQLHRRVGDPPQQRRVQRAGRRTRARRRPRRSDRLASSVTRRRRPRSAGSAPGRRRLQAGLDDDVDESHRQLRVAIAVAAVADEARAVGGAAYAARWRGIVEMARIGGGDDRVADRAQRARAQRAALAAAPPFGASSIRRRTISPTNG